MKSRLEILKKHAKHFTNANHNNDAAKVVHFYKDGSLFMTDSHKALLAYKVHEFNNNFTMFANGKPSKIPVYERYKSFFSDENTENFDLGVTEMLNMVQTFEAVAKVQGVSSSGRFLIEAKDNTLLAIYRGDEVEGFYNIKDSYPQSELKIAFDISLVVDTLKLFKDLGYESCTFYYNGRFRPTELRSPDGYIRALVLPCRIYRKEKNHDF